jgi:hypothetical protein
MTILEALADPIFRAELALVALFDLAATDSRHVDPFSFRCCSPVNSRLIPPRLCDAQPRQFSPFGHASVLAEVSV